MRPRTLVLMFLVAGMVCVALAIATFRRVKFQCTSNDEIAPAERAAIHSAALTFATAVVGSDAPSVLAMMTAEARANLTLESLTATMRQVDSQLRQHGDFKIARTDLVEGSGADSRAVCGRLRDHQWVAVNFKAGVRQAHVAVTTQTTNNYWQLSLWLIAEQGTWKVHLFHVGAYAMAGRNAETILALARTERAGGHTFNATMLYGALKMLMDRGPAYQLGIWQEAQTDALTFKSAGEFDGRSPYTWKLNGTDYTVGQTSIVGIEGKLGLIFALPQKDWNPGEADKINRAFLTAFMATHPDYSRVFEFLVARAGKWDGSVSFGTVFRADTGFK